VTFERAPVVAEQRIDLADALRLIGQIGLFTAECACATACSALEAARAYAADRWQGGGPIARHDALRLLLAGSTARLDSARSALMRAAQEPDSPRMPLAWLRARLPAVESAVQAASDAIQAHGGYGYMRDYGVEKRFRDAVSLSLLPLDGTRLGLLLSRLEDAEWTTGEAVSPIGRPRRVPRRRALPR